MSEASKKELAQRVYDSLCGTIRSRGWRFRENKERRMVRFGVAGDDIPMRFLIVVDEDRQLVRLLSRLPFTMKEDKRTEGAVAACACTHGLRHSPSRGLCHGLSHSLRRGNARHLSYLRSQLYSCTGCAAFQVLQAGWLYRSSQMSP